MTSSIYIIINNTIRKTKRGYTLTDRGFILINDLVQMGVDITLVGLVQYINDNKIDNILPVDVKIKKLNIIYTHKNNFYRIINYISSLVKLFFVCLSGKNFYVYVPSNISLITLFFLSLFGKDYGLYVRGAIRHSRLKGKIRHYSVLHNFYNHSIKKAKFLLVTGKYLYNDLIHISKNIQEVIPMIMVHRDDLVKYKDTSFCENLLFVGRIDKDKGVDELIEALSILVEKKFKFNLKMVGGGEQEYIGFIKDKIKIKGLEKKIILTGRISDQELLNTAYLDAHLFVFPSHHEGFPRVLYEAMTFGLPIVATDLDTYKGTMVSGYNCILTPVNKVHSLASSIELLMNDHQLRDKLSVNSIQYMNDKFSHYNGNSHAKQVVELFRIK